jgi:hypothetical protein
MPTDAEIVDQLRKLVKELERMDRSEDRVVRDQLRAILEGEDLWEPIRAEAEATRKEVVERIFGKGENPS